MYIVKCDTCASKYRISDISQIDNIDIRYYCKYCGRSFSIANQLAHININNTPFVNPVKKKNSTQKTFVIGNPKEKKPSRSTSTGVGFWDNKLKKFTLRKKFNIALVSTLILRERNK